MMMIWALGRRNKEVIWRPYRLKIFVCCLLVRVLGRVDSEVNLRP